MHALRIAAGARDRHLSAPLNRRAFYSRARARTCKQATLALRWHQQQHHREQFMPPPPPSLLSLLLLLSRHPTAARAYGRTAAATRRSPLSELTSRARSSIRRFHTSAQCSMLDNDAIIFPRLNQHYSFNDNKAIGSWKSKVRKHVVCLVSKRRLK